MMGLWNDFKLEKNINSVNEGVSLHFESGIEEGLKKEYLSFVKWLRKKYIFPVHMHIYILNIEKVRLSNGSLAYGSFRWYNRRNPRIKIPSLINYDEYKGISKEEIYLMVLSSLVHELTHYYQWIKYEEQEDLKSERQADYYRYNILKLYYKDIDRRWI